MQLVVSPKCKYAAEEISSTEKVQFQTSLQGGGVYRFLKLWKEHSILFKQCV